MKIDPNLSFMHQSDAFHKLISETPALLRSIVCICSVLALTFLIFMYGGEEILSCYLAIYILCTELEEMILILLASQQNCLSEAIWVLCVIFFASFYCVPTSADPSSTASEFSLEQVRHKAKEEEKNAADEHGQSKINVHLAFFADR